MISKIMIQRFSIFGDIIVLDSTYNCNKFKYPLFSFLGIDSNGKNTIFGLSVLKNETKLQFTWVLTTFFEFMKTKTDFVSEYIISDEDKALFIP